MLVALRLLHCVEMDGHRVVVERGGSCLWLFDFLPEGCACADEASCRANEAWACAGSAFPIRGVIDAIFFAIAETDLGSMGSRTPEDT